jgi:hypothetical protein
VNPCALSVQRGSFFAWIILGRVNPAEHALAQLPLNLPELERQISHRVPTTPRPTPPYRRESTPLPLAPHQNRQTSCEAPTQPAAWYKLAAPESAGSETCAGLQNPLSTSLLRLPPESYELRSRRVTRFWCRGDCCLRVLMADPYLEHPPAPASCIARTYNCRRIADWGWEWPSSWLPAGMRLADTCQVEASEGVPRC